MTHRTLSDGRLGVAVATTLAALVCSLCVDVSADDWPRWRGPNGNGISSETGWSTDWPEDGPKVLWRTNVGAGFSCIVVAGGRAYTMGGAGDRDTVWCFDAETGKVVWKQSYDCRTAFQNYSGPRATPTVDGNRVYTFSGAGHLNCYDAATGKSIWSKKASEGFPTWAFASSPVVYGETVVVNAGGAGTAFNKTTGEEVWTTGGGKSGYASAVPYVKDGKTTLLVFSQKSLFAVDPKSGSVAWSFPWETAYDVNAADPVIAGERIFISSGYKTGCALLSVEGGEPNQLWRNTDMKNHVNSTVLHEGGLYGFHDSTLRCLDLESGEVKWSQGGYGKGSLILADGKLIVLGQGGNLAVAEASMDGFRKLAEAKVLTVPRGGVCWTSPVLANGRIYCRNSTGDVVCLDVKGN